MAKIEIPPLGKHMCFLGMTGSGKSELCQQMINAYSKDTRLFCIDPDESVDELKNVKIVRSPQEAKFWSRFYKRLRYIPRSEYMNRWDWEDLLQWLLESSSKKKPNPLIVHINEIYRLGYGSNFPVALPVIMATARKRKISMFIETQRPKAIPIPVLTEASRIYTFILRRSDDRKYIAGYVGGSKEDTNEFLDALNHQEKNFNFIEIDGDSGKWRSFRPINIKK